MILRSPFPRIYYYYNKRLQIKESQYFILIYSWTLIPILNWTYSVMTISHFQCTAPSTWLTNYADPSMRLDHQLEKDVSYKVFQFIIRWRSWSSLVTKPYGAQTQQLLQELGQTRFPVTLFFTLVELCSCATFVTFYGP